VSVTDIVATLGKLPLLSLVLGFLLYVLVQVLRAVRSWFLLRGAVPLGKLITITCVHNSLVNVLPARTGELSYIYLVKRTGKANTGTGVGTLALARFFDLLVVVAFFYIALLLVDVPTAILSARVPVLIIVGVLMALLAFAILFSKQAVTLGQRVLNALGLSKMKFFQWCIAKADETFHSLHVVKSWKPVVGALACTLGVWISLFTVNYLIFVGIGVTDSVAVVVVASAIAALLSTIPVQGLVGLGTIEAYWTIGLTAVGVPSAVAVSAGFAQHLVALLYIFILGMYGIFRVKSQ
jgi:hypothetical protein